MKKTVSIVLTTAMLAGVLAGCGGKTQPTTEPTQVEAPAESVTTAPQETVPAGENGALTILQTIWDDYAQDEKFPATGGDMGETLNTEPGIISPENFSNLGYTLLIPETYLSQLEEAATLMHMMNANTFTGGVVKLPQDADLTAFAQEMRDVILNNNYVCGFPDRMLIAQVDGYLLISFGIQETMDLFQSHLTAVYPQAQILHTDAIGG